MAQPVVQSLAPSPAQPRQTVLVTGTGFGFVVSAFLVDNMAVAHETAYLQVADGQHAIITIPPDITVNADYTVVLVTLENEASINEAGLLTIDPISGVLPPTEPTDTPDPFPLPETGESVGLDRLRARVRLELGDQASTFQASVIGDGATMRYDLPVRHVDVASVIAVKIPGDDPDDPVTLTKDTDYTVSAFDGSISLVVPLPRHDRLVITGTRYRFFENDVLDQFIQTAFVQVTHGRRKTTVAVSPYGYRLYEDWPMAYDTLPEVEILPTAILAKIEALWVLATDAAYDIDISEDGASIPRSERYRQLMQQISAETSRFNEMAHLLNIGLSRIEMTNLRRVSRTTGRLVPLYVDREYDNHGRPIRVLPGIDHGTGSGGTEFVETYFSTGGSM